MKILNSTDVPQYTVNNEKTNLDKYYGLKLTGFVKNIYGFNKK